MGGDLASGGRGGKDRRGDQQRTKDHRHGFSLWWTGLAGQSVAAQSARDAAAGRARYVAYKRQSYPLTHFVAGQS